VPTIDPGAALRDWLNARDVRRWQRRRTLPLILERAYWTAYEYQQDLGRLQRFRYRVISTRVQGAYPDLWPNVTVAGPRMVRARAGKRAVLYRVTYELPEHAE